MRLYGFQPDIHETPQAARTHWNDKHVGASSPPVREANNNETPIAKPRELVPLSTCVEIRNDSLLFYLFFVFLHEETIRYTSISQIERGFYTFGYKKTSSTPRYVYIRYSIKIIYTPKKCPLRGRGTRDPPQDIHTHTLAPVFTKLRKNSYALCSSRKPPPHVSRQDLAFQVQVFVRKN